MFTHHVNHWDLKMYCNQQKRQELSVSVTLKQKEHQHISAPLFLAVCLNHRCDIRSRYQTQRWHLFQSNENLLGWRICQKKFWASRFTSWLCGPLNVNVWLSPTGPVCSARRLSTMMMSLFLARGRLYKNHTVALDPKFIMQFSF